MKTQHFNFVDALRGYAILAVIIVHVASALPPTAGPAMRLFEQGARGVQLFYVASALTLLMSWHSRKDGYVPFMIRRVFRIFPLFWLAIPGYLIFAGRGPGYFAPSSDWSGIDVIRSLFFLDAFSSSNGSLVPGGWTITTEMFFYVLFPIWIFLIKSWRVAITVQFVLWIVISKFSPMFFGVLYLAFPNIPQYLIAVWGTLSLPLQFPVFLSGFVVYFLLQDEKILPSINNKLLWLLLVFSVFIMFAFAFLLPKSISIAYSFPFTILVFCFGRGVGGMLINKTIIALGKVSFSAYILHFMVLNVIYISRDNGFDFFWHEFNT